MVPQLALYQAYEETHRIAIHRNLTHEQVWQLAYNDAKSSVGFMYYEQIMLNHYQRLNNPPKV